MCLHRCSRNNLLTHMLCSSLTESKVSSLPASNKLPPDSQGSCSALSLITFNCLS